VSNENAGPARAARPLPRVVGAQTRGAVGFQHVDASLLGTGAAERAQLAASEAFAQ
jgi:hypothetical protein